MPAPNTLVGIRFARVLAQDVISQGIRRERCKDHTADGVRGWRLYCARCFERATGDSADTIPHKDDALPCFWTSVKAKKVGKVAKRNDTYDRARLRSPRVVASGDSARCIGRWVEGEHSHG